MKKEISIFSISLLVIGGLVLAVPFTQLRTNLGAVTTKYTNKTIASLGIGINNPSNMSIADYINSTLQSNSTYILNGTNEKFTSNNGVVMYNRISQPGTNNKGQQLIASDVQYLENNARTISSITNTTTRNANGLSMRSPNSSNRTSGIAIKNNQAIAMSGTTSNSSSVSSVRQLAGAAPPPSEAEVIGTLPIGDGYIFMLIMASIIAILKSRKLAY